MREIEHKFQEVGFSMHPKNRTPVIKGLYNSNKGAQGLRRDWAIIF